MRVSMLQKFKMLSNCAIILLFVFSILIPSTLSGCGVNFDKMRTRRIEAIRGQILSKLGMTQLPYNAGPRPTPPLEIEEMYNRTRDFVTETARQKRIQCEEPDDEYYAQEIITVEASRNDVEPQSESMKNYQAVKLKKEMSEFFNFDLSSQNIDPDLIMSASLRLYQVQTSNGGRQQVELYQLSPGELEISAPTRQFLTMKLIDTYGKGWVNFDVTSTIRHWIRNPTLNQGFEVTVSCSEEKARTSGFNGDNKLKVIFEGSQAHLDQLSSRGDQEFSPDTSTMKNRGHLVIMVRSPGSHASQNNGHRRRKRSLDADFCFRRRPDEANCCLRELFINFRQDLGWDWIHAPSGYNANFCAGACPYLWSMDTQHATILSLYKSMNPHASSSPCCTPKELEPLTIMYYDKGKFKLTQMTDMVLLSCKCS